MRKGLDGLAMLVQGVLRQDPFSGHLFVFRGRKANLVKIVYWDGTGLCLLPRGPKLHSGAGRMFPDGLG
jgi:transposase